MFSKSNSNSHSDLDPEIPDIELKIRDVNIEIQEVKEQVVLGIDKTIDRGEKLEELELKADSLKDTAQLFKKEARKAKWEMWKQKCKANMVLIIVVVVVIAIVIITIAAIV